MTHVRISKYIAAEPEEVRSALAHIESHVQWMADAREIRFTSPTRTGVGATFECVTRVGHSGRRM